MADATERDTQYSLFMAFFQVMSKIMPMTDQNSFVDLSSGHRFFSCKWIFNEAPSQLVQHNKQFFRKKFKQDKKVVVAFGPNGHEVIGLRENQLGYPTEDQVKGTLLKRCSKPSAVKELMLALPGPIKLRLKNEMDLRAFVEGYPSEFSLVNDRIQAVTGNKTSVVEVANDEEQAQAQTMVKSVDNAIVNLMQLVNYTDENSKVKSVQNQKGMVFFKMSWILSRLPSHLQKHHPQILGSKSMFQSYMKGNPKFVVNQNCAQLATRIQTMATEQDTLAEIVNILNQNGGGATIEFVISKMSNPVKKRAGRPTNLKHFVSLNGSTLVLDHGKVMIGKAVEGPSEDQGKGEKSKSTETGPTNPVKTIKGIDNGVKDLLLHAKLCNENARFKWVDGEGEKLFFDIRWIVIKKFSHLQSQHPKILGSTKKFSEYLKNHPEFVVQDSCVQLASKLKSMATESEVLNEIKTLLSRHDGGKLAPEQVLKGLSPRCATRINTTTTLSHFVSVHRQELYFTDQNLLCSGPSGANATEKPTQIDSIDREVQNLLRMAAPTSDKAVFLTMNDGQKKLFIVINWIFGRLKSLYTKHPDQLGSLSQFHDYLTKNPNFTVKNSCVQHSDTLQSMSSESEALQEIVNLLTTHGGSRDAKLMLQELSEGASLRLNRQSSLMEFAKLNPEKLAFQAPNLYLKEALAQPVVDAEDFSPLYDQDEKESKAIVLVAASDVPSLPMAASVNADDFAPLYDEEEMGDGNVITAKEEAELEGLINNVNLEATPVAPKAKTEMKVPCITQ